MGAGGFLPPVVLEIMSRFNESGVEEARAAVRELNAMDARVRARVNVAGLPRLARLQEQMAALQDRDVHARVDVDGYAEVRAMRMEMSRVRSRTVRLNVVTTGGTGGVGQIGQEASRSSSQIRGLIVAGLAIAPAIVPAAAAAAAGIVAIGAAASVAAAGVGAMFLGLAGPLKAVQAMGAATKAAGGGGGRAADTANQMTSALEGLRSAERGLASAQRDATRAQESLNEARESARRSLEDMNRSLRQGMLDQRQGALDVRKALTEWRKVRADPTATRDEREQARLTYEQAQENIDRLRVEQERLRTDTDAANKKGVEGSNEVRDAQERIIDTQDRLTAALEQVASAHRAIEQAAKGAGASGGAALNTLNMELAKLSPEGRKFAYFLRGLVDGPLLDLRHAAERGLLPGLQRGIEMLLPHLGGLKRFIGNVSETLGGMAVSAARALGNPVWQRFFGYIDRVASPALVIMGKIVGNLGEAFAGLMVAFAPITKQIALDLEGMTRSFADWANDSNSSLREFIDYVRTRGPLVVETLGDLARTMLYIAKATAPLGDAVLIVIQALGQAIRAIPVPVLTALATAILLVTTSMKVMSLAAGLARGAMAAMASGAGMLGLGLGLVAVPAVLVASKFQEQKNAVAAAKGSFAELTQGLVSGSSEQVTAVLAQNEAVRNFMTVAHDAGISQKDLTAALQGDAKAREAVLSTYDAQTKAILRLRVEQAKAEGKDFGLDELAALGRELGRGREAFSQFSTEQEKARDVAAKYTSEIQKQDQAMSDVKRATDDMRRGFETYTDGIKGQTEATEAILRATDDWAAAVREHGTQLDLNGVKLGTQRQNVLATRDAMEAALLATRDSYYANIQAGMSVEAATKAHAAHVKQILAEIPEGQRNTQVVRDLVDAYGSIPGDISTQVRVDGAERALQQLRDMAIAKYAFEHGVSIPESREIANEARRELGRAGHATGGPVRGAGTGTSDSIPAWLSNGEHIWTALEVQAAGGHAAVSQMRQAVLSGGVARGGGSYVPVASSPAPPQMVEVHTHLYLDGAQVAEQVHTHLMATSQQHKYRSGVSGLG